LFLDDSRCDIKAPRYRKSLIRPAILLGTIPLALVVGSIADSQDAFIAVMAIGVLANVILRLTLQR
jgi:hypothetical protein